MDVLADLELQIMIYLMLIRNQLLICFKFNQKSSEHATQGLSFNVAATPWIGMNAKSGKAGIEQFAHIDKKNYVKGCISSSSTIYSLQDGDLKYEFLLRPKLGASSLFVMFSGDALRNKYQPPVFQRWSWSKHFPGHCLYFSDPVLHLDPSIGLGWYSGTKDQDALETIVKITAEIAAHLQIDKQKIASYGSSGGGFASLRFIHLLGSGTAICINPQIITYKYYPRHFNKYVEICYPGMNAGDVIKNYSDKLDLTALGGGMAQQKIIYIQNLQDMHHVQKHFKPFCASLGDDAPMDPGSSLPDFHKILFNDPGGHAKGESPDEFKRAMKLLVSN